MSLDDVVEKLEAIRQLIAVLVISVGLMSGMQLWRIVVQAKNERDFS